MQVTDPPRVNENQISKGQNGRPSLKLGSLNKSPGFFLRRENGRTTTSGSASEFLGYTLDDRDGIWSRWDWDDKRFELRTDRYGLYPTYYFKDAQGFGVSTSIIELLKFGVNRELDDPALAVFLRLGFFLGEDTPFRQIRATPPGATIRETAGKWEMTAPGLPSLRDGKPPTRAAAIEEFGIRFQAAVDALVPEHRSRVCVPLSGGRDSRHILFALAHGGNAPTCCATSRHFPPKSDEDARIAAEIAATLGIRHFVINSSKQPIRAELEKNELTNFCADEHAWILELSRFVRSGGYEILYDGIGGDVLSAGLFLTPKNLGLYRHGKLTELAEILLGDDSYLNSMLSREARGRWRREIAVERLVTELVRHANAPNPTGQFYFWNRTRREIALKFCSILGRDAHVLAPYLATPVYDFLASLPVEYFLDHGFHTEAIAQNYPAYAHLPFEAQNVSQNPLRWFDLLRWTGQVASYCMLGKQGAYRNPKFMFPRLVKGLIDPGYGMHQLNLWTIPLYLEQLARMEQKNFNATDA
jgi:asparagine synthase (glutamine-hydrolysing)